MGGAKLGVTPFMGARAGCGCAQHLHACVSCVASSPQNSCSPGRAAFLSPCCPHACLPCCSKVASERGRARLEAQQVTSINLAIAVKCGSSAVL